MTARGQEYRELGVTEAVSEVIRLIASDAYPGSHSFLYRCPLCRNHLMYLLDRPGDMDGFSRVVLARLRSLPVTHEMGHGNPGSPDMTHSDARRPEIHGFSS